MGKRTFVCLNVTQIAINRNLFNLNSETNKKLALLSTYKLVL